MTGRNVEDWAVEVVARHETWRAKVAQLTAEIGNTVCPHTVTDDPEGALEGLSCFGKARTETTDADNWRPGYADRPLNLEEILEEVRDCQACERLVLLIRKRKDARRELGNARRSLSYCGKAVLREEENG